MKNILLCGLALLALLGLVGCSGAGTPSSQPSDTPIPPAPVPADTAQPTQPPATAAPSNSQPVSLVVQSDKPRAVLNELSPDVGPLVSGNSAFAFDLYQKLRGAQGNLFYSPYSISMALAMAYAGAHGATAQQMADTLHFTLAPDRLHPALNSLDQALASRGQGAAGTNGQGFKLKVANAIWGDQGHQFQPTFLDTLAQNYGAGLRVVDMQHAPEPTRNLINQWVSDQTEGKIKDLLPAGSITPASKLVLTNAIYFNAAWQFPFKPEQTDNGTFNLLDNTKITVPMMHATEHYGYAKGSGYQAVELSYDGNQLAMDILVPDAGQFPAFESSLDAKRVDSIVNSLEGQQVILSMPKWKFDSSFTLGDTLQGMGMKDAFNPDAADFTGMDGQRDLFISQVVHKAFVDVGEAGTEAAAATGIVMTAGAMPMQLTTLTIDRPFIFLIRDLETNAILFVGRVEDPR